MVRAGKGSSGKANAKSGAYVIRSAVGGRAVVAGSKTGKSAAVREALKSGQLRDRGAKTRGS